jgi:anti-sigma factor RsiW
MATCEPFNDQLLPFVYDVLDEGEAQVLRSHLEDCPRCQERLTRARGQRALFGRAALPIGPPEVPAFVPPDDAITPVADETPPTIVFPTPIPGASPATRRRPRYRYVLAMAVAAAMLLAVGVLTWRSYDDGYQAHNDAIAAQQAVIREIDAQLAALEGEFKTESRRIEQKVRAAAPPHVYMLAPTQLQPAGGEVVQLMVNDIAGKPATAKITLSVVDPATKQVLSQQETVTHGGTATVPLSERVANALRVPQQVQLIAEADVGTSQARIVEMLPVAPPMYVSHLVTNKTIYRPGDVVFCRAFLLDRATLTPPTERMPLRFSLVDAGGRVIAATTTHTIEGGIATVDFAIAPQRADGHYEVRVDAANPGKPEVRPHVRKLQVARDVSYDVQVERELYKAGDLVNLAVQVPRLQRVMPDGVDKKQGAGGGKAPGMAPHVDLSVNGTRVANVNAIQGSMGGFGTGGLRGGPQSGSTPPQNSSPPQKKAAPQSQAQPPPAPAGVGGGAGAMQSGFGANFGNASALATENAYQMYFSFALPKDLDTSRAHIRIVLTEGAFKETFEQDITVVPSRLTVDLCPEGGDLVPGVPNRVYYRVRSPRGEPVNPEGRVIVRSGNATLLDSVAGEGAGSFSFTPRTGDTYTVEITTAKGLPIEVTSPFARLGNRTGELVLHTPRPVGNEAEPLYVILRNPAQARRVLVVAECRGRCVGQQWADANGPETAVALGNLPGACGVVRVTVYDQAGGALRPLAERLIYRLPAHRLDVSALNLGGIISSRINARNANIEIRARNEAGEPVPAWILAAVADERFRTREPSTLAHFFVAGDVQSGEDLDNAVLIAAEDPATRKALDLFLGTAGWRHFESGPVAEAAVAPVPSAMFFGRENMPSQGMLAQYKLKVEAAIAEARTATERRYASLTGDRQTAQSALQQAHTELETYAGLPMEYFRLGLGIATLLLVVLACLGLAVGAWRLMRRHQATPLFAGALASVALCIVAAFLMHSLPEAMEPHFAAGTEARPGRLATPMFAQLLPSPGLPTGTFVPAADPKAAADAKGVAVARAGKRDEIRLEQLAEATRLHNERGGAQRLAAAAAMGNKDRSELRDRYNRALASQDTIPAPPVPAPTPGGPKPPAPKMSKSFAPVKPLAPAPSPAPATAPSEQETVSHRAYINVGSADFDTLLWYPDLFLQSGSRQLAFEVPPSAAVYRVLLIGHTADGRLGFYEGRLDVQPEPGR